MAMVHDRICAPGTVSGFAFYYGRTAHRCARQQIQSATFDGLAVRHHAVAHMRSARHDGSAAPGIRIACSGHGGGGAVNQVKAVDDGLFC